MVFKKGRCIYSMVLFCLLGSVMLTLYRMERKDIETIEQYQEGELFAFSEEKSFHTGSFAVEIERAEGLPKELEIYYTLDGNPPTEASEKYTGPIEINYAGGIQAVPLRAAAYYKGNRGKILSKTYFLSEEIENRYDNLIVSINGSYEELFGEEKGILYGINDGFNPKASYEQRGMEWERPVSVEIFTKDGECLLNQNAGVRISGDKSRRFQMKSLKLYARKQYDEKKDKFELEIFGNHAEEKEENHYVKKYEKLLLRSGGNDWKRTMLRWNFTSRLAGEAGLSTIPSVEFASVYINGFYYGMESLQPVYSEDFIASLYGFEENSIEILQGGDTVRTTDDAIFDSENLNAIQGGYAELLEQDLTKEENREKLEQVIDIQDYLLYYAFQMVVNNGDWPQKNYKIWRYQGEEQPGNPYSDGRWRPLIFDIDWAFSYHDVETFDELLVKKERRKQMLSKLLTYEGYKNQLIQNICDLLAGTLTEENVLRKIAEEDAKMQNEKERMLNETLIYEKLAFILSTRDGYMKEMRDFMQERPAFIYQFLEEYFGLSEPYELTVQVPDENAKIVWNSLELVHTGQPFSGKYYKEIPLELSCLPAFGYEFDYWLVNGERVETETLVLSERIKEGGEVLVQAAVKRAETEDALPVLSEISCKSVDNYLEFYNPYPYEISLDQICISDEEANLKKFHLKGIWIKPGGRVKIYGKSRPPLHSYVLNFNLNKGKVIYVSDLKGTLLSRTGVPKLYDHEAYIRSRYQDKWVVAQKETIK